MGFIRRAGLLGVAVTFLQSERGQQLVRQAREKYDTPANRAKARDAVQQVAATAQSYLRRT